MNKYTPIIQQYLKIKSEHKDKLLLFRIGDFYELFFEDAIEASKLLLLTLTKKGKSVPMAGFPFKSLNSNIIKLMKANKKVAICEQIGIEKKNGLIERAVVIVLTPGTFFNDDYLSPYTNNYITCIFALDGFYGIAALDVSIGYFFITRVDSKIDLYNEIDRMNPVEILVSDKSNFSNLFPKRFLNIISSDNFNFNFSYDVLVKFFGSKEINNIDSSYFYSAIIAAGCLLDFVLSTQRNKLENIVSLEVHGINSFLHLDCISRRNLELFKSLSDNEKDSLFNVIDKTSTFMGKRLLRQWLTYPILSRCVLNDRLISVSIMKTNQSYLKIKSLLLKFFDLDRILSKIVFSIAQPLDLKRLQLSLELFPLIKSELNTIGLKGLLDPIFHNIDFFDELVNLINKAVIDNPMHSIRDGDFVKNGFDKRLDKYKKIIKDLSKSLINYKENEKNRLNISSLDLVFVNGNYFLEILKSESHKIDIKYKKVSFGTRNFRYITDELRLIEKKFIETKIKIADREKRIYKIILYKIKKKIISIKNAVKYVSILDVLCSFAEQSSLFDWCEPILVDEDILDIKSGRHPVVEYKKKSFIPNDLFLDLKIKSLIITGANMGGKSTYMRQCALIVLLSHIGSHVPAGFAKIGFIDKIFTRIGSGDDLANSYSTFMLEMKEMSDILVNSTKNSLILIDEIGRGTGHLDGKALAFSIIKYLVEVTNSFFLFSTHFHDMCSICNVFKSIGGIYFIVINDDNELKFFYKFKEGFSDNSFGIEVARIAGIPKVVIDFAYKKIDEFNLEKDNTNLILNSNVNIKNLLDFINKIDPNSLSPKDALELLYVLKKKFNTQL